MLVSSRGSVSQWIADLKGGNGDAARAIWRRYFGRLASVARRRLGKFPRRVFDEEDIALSVLDTLCRGVEAGRFPDLLDRNDLWSLLLVITKRKTIDNKRWQTRSKRGGSHSTPESSLDDTRTNQSTTLDAVIGEEPTPDFVVALREEHERLMALLRDDMLRDVARLKMEGHSSEEIAERLQLSVRSVQRKLQLIQTSWEQELEQWPE